VFNQLVYTNKDKMITNATITNKRTDNMAIHQTVGVQPNDTIKFSSFYIKQHKSNTATFERGKMEFLTRIKKFHVEEQ